MRTTVRLHPQLLAQAKQFAVASGKTLTSLLEEALRVFMARRPQRRAVGRLRLKTFRGTGTCPGVDLDNHAQLLDLMDAPHDPD